MALTQLELITEGRLKHDFGPVQGGEIWAGFLLARQKALFDVASFISQTEPHLSDHGPRHIENVLDNAYALLGETKCTGTDSQTSLNATELYFLVLSILFHDLGNIHGRKDHNRAIERAYSYARGNDVSMMQEKRILFAVVEAHCGQTFDGSKDTIGKLDSKQHFKQQRVDCQRVASILRLADELAEGPQRTSAFMRTHFPVDPESEVYHDYAAATAIHIDGDNERIILTYDIEVAPAYRGEKYDESKMRSLLNLCYRRAVKLDLERKYNRHYCSLLRPFKRTEISFHFCYQGQDLKIAIPMITLDDLVLPSDQSNVSLVDRERSLQLSLLLPSIREAIARIA